MSCSLYPVRRERFWLDKRFGKLFWTNTTTIFFRSGNRISNERRIIVSRERAARDEKSLLWRMRHYVSRTGRAERGESYPSPPVPCSTRLGPNYGAAVCRVGAGLLVHRRGCKLVTGKELLLLHRKNKGPEESCSGSSASGATPKQREVAAEASS